LWRRGGTRGYPESDKAFDTAGRGAKNRRMPALADAVSYRTRSVEQAREHVAGVFAAHRLACGARELDFTHQQIDRPHLSLNRLRYGAPVVVDAPALERFYLLQLTLAGSCEIELARRTVTVRPGALLVINPTRPYRKRWSADCTQLIARLDRSLVEDAWAARHGVPPRRVLEFSFANLPAPAAALLGAVLRRAAAGRAHDRLIAEALVDALPPAESDDDAPAAAMLVRRAESFMSAHLGQDLAIADIAQAAGTTTRTLERAFRRERRATAVVRLRELRLERARALLLAPSREVRCVTEVAVSAGLMHAGRFACEYRRRFGESPSETLHNARGRAPA
jgi:AraC-like DNA-binding protein